MSQTIHITVSAKRAETEATEVVSHNGNYLLTFSFDGEWAEYYTRCAVVLWEGGGAEHFFTGTQCEMPAVLCDVSDSVLVGVYAEKEGVRISSSYVRLSCVRGAHGRPSAAPSCKSFHEEVIAFLNAKDWSVFEEKVSPGRYSSVAVNALGQVTGGGDVLEIGEEGQASPSASLAEGGLFLGRETDGVRLYRRTESGAEPLTVKGVRLSGKLTVAGKTYDGTQAVSVTAEDFHLANVYTPAGSVTFSQLVGPNASVLGNVYNVTDSFTTDERFLEGSGITVAAGSNVAVVRRDNEYFFDVFGSLLNADLFVHKTALSEVAFSGAYADLSGRPTVVESVAGRYGAVTLTKDDVGLGNVPNLHPYPVGSVYISVLSVSPASLFGGTWEKIEGKFLLAAGSSFGLGTEGGSSAHTHDYGFSLPEYHASPLCNSPYAGALTGGVTGTDNIASFTYANGLFQGDADRNSGLSSSATVASVWLQQSVTSTSASSTLPPYLAVSVWKRTA